MARPTISFRFPRLPRIRKTRFGKDYLIPGLPPPDAPESWTPVGSDGLSAYLFVDHAAGNYWASGHKVPDLATFSTEATRTFARASTKFSINSSGVLTSWPNDVAVIARSPVDLTPRGLALETARTNMQTGNRSNAGSPNWAGNALIAASAVLTRDGVTPMTRLTTTGTNAAQTRQTAAAISPVFVAGQWYTQSWEVRRVSWRYVQLTFGSAAFDTTAYANFDLQTGTITQVVGCEAAIVALGDNRFRLVMSKQCVTGAVASPAAVLHIAQSGTSTRLLAWGSGFSENLDVGEVQCELGRLSESSIIITPNSAQAARESDMETFSGPTQPFPGFLQERGCLLWEGATNIEGTLFDLTDGSSMNRIRARVKNDWSVELLVVNGGVQQQLLTGGTVVRNTKFRIAVAFQPGQVDLWKDGVQLGTGVSGNLPEAVNKMTVGRDVADSDGIVGYLTALGYLADPSFAKLSTLSAIGGV